MSNLRILDAPGQREQLWPLSVAAYHALGDMGLIPEKTELLHGFVFRKMPKSPLHRAVIQRLLAQLNLCIAGHRLWLQSEQPLHCGGSEPEPDVSVIAGSNEDFLNDHPTTAELVIEVAVTTHEADLAKAEIYAAAGVKEYWLVDVPGRRAEIRRAPQGGEYAETIVVPAGEMASSAVLPGFSVNVRELLRQ